MNNKFQVGIIGGGLAGFCAAIHLGKLGYSVVLWEKGEYPRHKVCGEFVSNETLTYLHYLGFNPFELGAVKIDHLTVSHWNGKSTNTQLEQGAFGISRYAFEYNLMLIAQKNGVVVRLKENVTSYTKNNEGFEVKTSKGEVTQVEILLSAHGKKSNMDRIMERPFFQKDADYIGVKYHFNYSIPSNHVALHNFETGYCGVSMVEDERINICYLSTKTALKKYGSIDELENNLVRKNPFLNDVFTNGKKLFTEPKTISDFSFKPKAPVENGILMLGDAAGLITPLCGNGMAMAIHAAYIAGKTVNEYFQHKITRTELEEKYTVEWRKTFHSRIKFGYRMQKIMGKPHISAMAMQALQIAPFLLHPLVKQSHGKDFFKS